MIMYSIEKGLRAVEQLVLESVKNTQTRNVLETIQRWRQQMAHPIIDEGAVTSEVLTLDNIAFRELMIPGSPLNDCRSIDTYTYWWVMEQFTRDQFQLRFFDLCVIC